MKVFFSSDRPSAVQQGALPLVITQGSRSLCFHRHWSSSEGTGLNCVPSLKLLPGNNMSAHFSMPEQVTWHIPEAKGTGISIYVCLEGEEERIFDKYN